MDARKADGGYEPDQQQDKTEQNGRSDDKADEQTLARPPVIAAREIMRVFG